MKTNHSDREYPLPEDLADHQPGQLDSPLEDEPGIDAFDIGGPFKEDDAISACVRFIEQVQQECPNCLADFSRAPEGRGTEWNDLATPAESESQIASEQMPLLNPWLHGEEPTRIGRFHILDKLGEGGFGLVLLAYDPELARQVALKIPRAEALFTEELRKRFLQEGKAVACLNHPNIAPVYEAGKIGPVCYIVSAYCGGGSLADLLRTRSNKSINQDRPDLSNSPNCLPFRSVVLLMSSLADAIEHAHERGFLHRDLKPSNILFDVDGHDHSLVTDHGTDWARTARVVDFGLAKSLNTEDQRTLTGTTLGTPTYMSPEQVEGDPTRIGRPTDVYSLGCIFYELLTGRPPLKGPSHVATMTAVKNEYPLAPRKRNGACPKDLEAICLMCLEKDPQRRYSTASALVDDLRRYLVGVPIRARTPSPIGRDLEIVQTLSDRRSVRCSLCRIGGGWPHDRAQAKTSLPAGGTGATR